MADFASGLLRPSRVAGDGVVRAALVVILLMAAGLKTHQLATSPVVGDGFLDFRWFLIATVELKSFFGLWLLWSQRHGRGWVSSRVRRVFSESH